MTTITIERALLEQAYAMLSSNKTHIRVVMSRDETCVAIRSALAAPATAPEPVACLVETDGGAMVWPIDDIDEAGTYCEPDEFPILLYRATAPDELEQLRKDSERVAWYENNPEKVLNIGPRWYSRNGYGLPMKRRKGFREAIDAAMKETP